jgi:putative phosphoesterase
LDVKVGIVSDIHCNADGLRDALDVMGEIDELLCLGDAIFEYQFSNEVAEILRRHQAHIIQGNHEEVFFSSAGSRARERDWIDRDLMGFMAGQPARRTVELGRKRFLLVHSTPWDPRGEYVYPHSGKLPLFADADADFVLYGHTHAQVVKRFGRVTIINPGSAGDARDARNDRQLSCAVVDTETDEVRVIDYADRRFPRG